MPRKVISASAILAGSQLRQSGMDRSSTSYLLATLVRDVWTVCGRSWHEIGVFSRYCEACLPRMPRSDFNRRRSKLLFPALEFGSLHAVITPL
jgi:hypothetical protein